ncbi:MAG: hypothetical protein IKC47_04715 [Clostridia bacterium]|nr:hypothetical protein [Clostridia bacterium]
MKAIKDIYTYQLPYYNYPVLKQVGTNEQANANKLPFDVLVDPNNHQPITLDLGAGEKIYCQVCVATMNFNSIDYLCAMLVEKQHASNIVAKGEGANVTFAVFDIKTKKRQKGNRPIDYNLVGRVLQNFDKKQAQGCSQGFVLHNRKITRYGRHLCKSSNITH